MMEKTIKVKLTNKFGRPSKWKDEYTQMLIDYFQERIDKGELPLLSEFTRNVMNVSEDTALRWYKENKSFNEAYKKAKEMQKEILIRQGLKQKWNPVFTIFTAKNITDMRDVKEEHHTGNITHGFVALPDLTKPKQIRAKSIT